MSARRLNVGIALALLCALPAPVFAAIPSATTTDPLQRTVLLSLGSVYRVETTVSVTALRSTKTGRVYPLTGLHEVTILGTAFAVTPTGVLIADAHVAAPFGTALADGVAPLYWAERGEFGLPAAYDHWVSANHIAPVGAHTIRMQVVRATASPNVPAQVVAAHIVPGSIDARDDLALLQISDHRIPALTFDESGTAGTPVATIGYGNATSTTLGLPTSTVPSIKTGVLVEEGTVGAKLAAQAGIEAGQSLIDVSVPVSAGDSGAPAVSSDLQAANGVVRLLYPPGGLIEPAVTVTNLIQRVLGIAPSNGVVYDDFASGMTALWNGDYTAAQSWLRKTIALDPTHPLARQELATATALAHARPGDGSRFWQRFFASLAVIASLAAIACVVRLRRLRRRDLDGGDIPSLPAAP